MNYKNKAATKEPINTGYSNYTDIFENRGHEYNKASEVSAVARQKEVDTLLDLAHFGENKVVMDAPAGGGIVAQYAVKHNLQFQNLICVEPAEQFAAGIPSQFSTLINELDEIQLGEQHVDILLSLAGLHHILDRMSVYLEWFRLLKKSGQLVIADVKAKTPTAEFLNGYVNENNPMGHEGVFFEDGEVSEALISCGFQVKKDQLHCVPWTFQSMIELGQFCKLLFNLNSHLPPEDVASAVKEIVGVNVDHNGVHMQWQLQYLLAVKPT